MTDGFVEFTSLRLILPLLAAIFGVLFWVSTAAALGFGLGAAAALMGAYFNLEHLRRWSARVLWQGKRTSQRQAIGGYLASYVLMGAVLAVSALVRELNLYATAGGLLLPRWLFGLGLAWQGRGRGRGRRGRSGV